LHPGLRLDKAMTKYVNMAPPHYEAEQSKGGALLPLMVAAAAAAAVYSGLDPDSARVMGMEVAGNAISWIDGFMNTVRVCSPTSGLYF
jgi:hypothetical protein